MKIKHTVQDGIPTTEIMIPSFDPPKHRHRHNDPSEWDLGVIGTGHFKCRSHRAKVYRKKFNYVLGFSSREPHDQAR